jgi:pyruvate-ferredoxin/flavodoxin oxidoreductase
MTFEQFAMQEARFAMLARSNPEHAKYLFQLAQRDINDQWHFYEQMAGLEREFVSEAQEAKT